MSQLKAYGTLLDYGDTADHATTTTWTSVATVKNIKPPKVAAKEIDVTHLTSADEFEETIAGLANGGEAEFMIQYNKTANVALYAFFRTTKAYRIRYTDASGWKFNGYITEFGDDEIVNGEIVTTTVKLKITGKPVLVSSGLS